MLKKIGFFIVLTLLIAGFAGCARSSGNLHVQVVSQDGAVVAGAKVVSNTQPDEQLKVTGMTGVDGSVTYNNIKAGEYSFYITAANYQQKDFDMNVAGGKTNIITITLTPTYPPAVTT
jgi:hypothetical protein